MSEELPPSCLKTFNIKKTCICTCSYTRLKTFNIKTYTCTRCFTTLGQFPVSSLSMLKLTVLLYFMTLCYVFYTIKPNGTS